MDGEGDLKEAAMALGRIGDPDIALVEAGQFANDGETDTGALGGIGIEALERGENFRAKGGIDSGAEVADGEDMTIRIPIVVVGDMDLVTTGIIGGGIFESIGDEVFHDLEEAAPCNGELGKRSEQLKREVVFSEAGGHGLLKLP